MLFMKTLSYITIAVDPLSSPHTQTILFRWTQATRKGGKCQCKTFPWVWKGDSTSHSEPQVSGRKRKEPGWWP